MVGLKSLEVYISIFNKTEEDSKFEIYTNFSDEFSFTELKDELEEVPGLSNILLELLQDKLSGSRSNNGY